MEVGTSSALVVASQRNTRLSNRPYGRWEIDTYGNAEFMDRKLFWQRASDEKKMKLAAELRADPGQQDLWTEAVSEFHAHKWLQPADGDEDDGVF